MSDPTDLPTALPTAANTAYTRRHMIAGGALGLCSLAIAGARAEAREPAADAAKTKTIIPSRAIHQEEDFKASPERIYEAILDSKQFSAFSGMAGAEVSGEVGGTFTIFGGHIVGRNLELLPNRRIVQSWRVVPWPEGKHSIARFELTQQGSGTRIIFDHTGFPPELAEHLESGWREHYWEPLRKYLG